MKILGTMFLILGTVSIIYNKQSGQSYAAFQKGWGLEGRTAIVVGRLIALIGGFLFMVIGLLIVYQ
ncbi:MAG TPA: hypothetical protein VF088_04350 [Pyrinomonadaceae bacterium]